MSEKEEIPVNAPAVPAASDEPPAPVKGKREQETQVLPTNNLTIVSLCDATCRFVLLTCIPGLHRIYGHRVPGRARPSKSKRGHRPRVIPTLLL